MKRGKSLALGVLLLGIIIVSMSFISAGLWGRITGKDVDTTEASVTLANDPPQILVINPPTVKTLTEDGTAGISFDYVVYDPNGVDDLKDISAAGRFYNDDNTPYDYDLATEPQRTERTFTTADCVPSDIPAADPDCGQSIQCRKYTCTVNMYYYDDSTDVGDVWDIDVSIEDEGGGSDSETSTDAFAPDLLYGFKVSSPSPAEITWAGVSSLDSDVEAEEPMLIENTGNYDFDGTGSSRRASVKGGNLYGDVTPTEFISATNFQTHVDTVNSGDCTAATGKLTLSTTDQEFTSAGFDLPYGDNSNANDAEENFYFCLIQIDAGLSSQGYSTTNGAGVPWEINLPSTA